MTVFQWLLSVAATILNIVTFVEAYSAMRLVRRMRVNGAYRAIVVGQILDEIGRLAIQAFVLFLTTAVLIYRPVGTFNPVLMALVLVVGAMTLNGVISRRKVLQALRKEIQR